MSGEIEALQSWYEAQCDGDWEHEFGIRIETLDNPGWSIEVNLEGTPLEGVSFDPIHDMAPAREWLTCRVEDGKFQGAGGAPMLGTLIRTFLAWAHQAPVTPSEGAV